MEERAESKEGGEKRFDQQGNEKPKHFTLLIPIYGAIKRAIS